MEETAQGLEGFEERHSTSDSIRRVRDVHEPLSPDARKRCSGLARKGRKG